MVTFSLLYYWSLIFNQQHFRGFLFIWLFHLLPFELFLLLPHHKPVIRRSPLFHHLLILSIIQLFFNTVLLKSLLVSIWTVSHHKLYLLLLHNIMWEIIISCWMKNLSSFDIIELWCLFQYFLPDYWSLVPFIYIFTSAAENLGILRKPYSCQLTERLTFKWVRDLLRWVLLTSEDYSRWCWIESLCLILIIFSCWWLTTSIIIWSKLEFSLLMISRKTLSLVLYWDDNRLLRILRNPRLIRVELTWSNIVSLCHNKLSLRLYIWRVKVYRFYLIADVRPGVYHISISR